METDIGFLQELREDLLTAAWRESIATERRPPRRRRRWFGQSHRKLVAVLATAATLLAAGGIGWYVTSGGEGSAMSAYAPMAPPAPITKPNPSAFKPGYGPWAGISPGARNPNDQALPGLGSKTAGQEAAPAVPGTPRTQGRGSPAGVNLPQDLSKIVKTATLSVVITPGTFGAKFQAAQQVAHKFGGYVQSSTTQGKRSGTLLIRVPERRFDQARGALAALGNVEHETVAGKNVTSSYIDLRARVSIAQTRRNTLERLMRKAHSISDTVRLQNEIDQVQLEIEQLQGELRVLNNQTSYGTIRVDLHEAGVVVTPPQAHVINPSLGNAVDHAVAGFLGVLFAVVIGLGYLVPIGALIVAAWFVASRFRRARVSA